MFAPTTRSIVLAILLVLLGTPSVFADGFRSVSIEELSGTPEEFEGKIITGGYVQLVGFAHFSQKSRNTDVDVALTTYKLWTEPDFKGAFILVVVEDENKSDFWENPPKTPILVQGAYYQLEGEWSQRDHVASPEIVPGSSVWALYAFGFD